MLIRILTLALALMTLMGCSADDSQPPNPGGQGRLVQSLVSTAPSGSVYFLRGVTLEVSQAGEVVTTLVSNDTDPASETELTTLLDAGPYSALLNPPTVTRVVDGEEVPVASQIASANPLSFTITEGETTAIAYTLAVAGERVTFGGNLTVDIDVREVPGEWTCNLRWYGGNDGCDCGCGIIDPDCADSTSASCEYCGSGGSCSQGTTCPSNIDPDYNWLCTTPDPDPDPSVPAEWTCATNWYGGGDGCDCGCGAVDPDCDDASSESCAYCGGTGSCSETGSSDCTDIDPDNNAICLP